MKTMINVAVIGLGNRGYSMMDNICKMNDVKIIGVCDTYKDRTKRGKEKVIKLCGNETFATTDYHEILELDNLDSVYIASDWSTHTEIAIDAMKKGIPAAFEVGGAYTVDECWKLVDIYEKTGTWAMMMENCCYGERELMVHNMTRQGILGKIVACSGQYAHDLRGEISHGTVDRHYRLRNYLSRNCENYPTHELGPIAKLLEINRGNRFVSLSSISSEACGMHDYVNRKNTPKVIKEELSNSVFSQSDIVKTFIKTERGELIELTLDTSLPRFYSRGYTIRGTRGMYQEDGDVLFLDKKTFTKHEFEQKCFWGRAKKYKNKYDHPLWANVTPEMLKSGHGGMDWFVLRAWIETIKNDTLPPIDVYDAASWMCVAPLSEESLKTGKTFEFPDFTRGKYTDRKDVCENEYKII